MGTLLYFALVAIGFFLMMRFGCGAHVMGHSGSTGHKHGGLGQLHWTPPDSDVDPVCGKTVHPEQAKSSVHDGMVYYFCSRECREQFEAAPNLYVGPAAIEDKSQQESHHVSNSEQQSEI